MKGKCKEYRDELLVDIENLGIRSKIDFLVIDKFDNYLLRADKLNKKLLREMYEALKETFKILKDLEGIRKLEEKND